MDASDEASDPFERLAVFQLGAAPAAARVDRKAETAMLAGKGWRDGRYFMLRQFPGKGMFFGDLRRAPAARTVELQHHCSAVFQPDLVDAVLVAVQREQPAVGAKAGAVAGVEHDVGRERRVGVRQGEWQTGGG